MTFPQYDCKDAGGRVPKVGPLGDAGAVTEIYPKSDRLLNKGFLSGESGCIFLTVYTIGSKYLE